MLLILPPSELAPSSSLVHHSVHEPRCLAGRRPGTPVVHDPVTAVVEYKVRDHGLTVPSLRQPRRLSPSHDLGERPGNGQRPPFVVLRLPPKQSDHSAPHVHRRPPEPEHVAAPPARQVREARHVLQILRQGVHHHFELGRLEELLPHVGVFRSWGRLRLIATLHDPAVIRKILAHLALCHSGQSPGPAPSEPGAATSLSDRLGGPRTRRPPATASGGRSCCLIGIVWPYRWGGGFDSYGGCPRRASAVKTTTKAKE